MIHDKLNTRIGELVDAKLKRPGAQMTVSDPIIFDTKRLQVSISQVSRLRGMKVTTCRVNGAVIATRIT